MAAPSARLFCNFQTQFYRMYVCREYARYGQRRVHEVMSPDKELERVKHKVKPTNPRTNPYIPFTPGDPVQKSQASLYELSQQSRKEDKRDKYFMKDYKKKNTNDRSSKSETPDKQTKPRVKAMVMMSGEAAEHDQEEEYTVDSDTRRQAGLQLIDPDIIYKRLDDGDRQFGQAIQRATVRNLREKRKEIVLEGRRLIKDALDAGAELKSLYFSGRDTLHGFRASELQDAPVYKVLHRHMKIWSAVNTPQGLLGVFSMPEEGKAIVEEPNRLPITLICDEVREPGNMGTLLRTAAAVGCQKIITSKGCVDIWNNKVVRSGAGCHFRIPIVTNVKWSDMNNHVKGKNSVFLADFRQPTPELLAEISGSEKAVDAIESLREKSEGVTESSFASDNVKSEPADETSDVDDDDDDDEAVQVYKDAPIGVTSYYKVSFVRGETVLIIGGETQGISNKARKFAYENYGQYLTLPMLGGVNSLNCAVAGSVILYEMGKQFRQKENSSVKTNTS